MPLRRWGRWSGLLLAAVTLLQAQALRAQSSDAPSTLSNAPRVASLYLDDVFPGARGERLVEMHFRALNSAGFTVQGLQPSDLSVLDDDRRIDAARIELFPLQRTGQGVSAVLAIDASGTMRGEPFARAKEAALSFLERLRPEDRVAVLTFAENISVAAGFELSRVETRQVLSGLEIDEERMQRTRLFDGAHAGLDLIRRGLGLPRRSFMILFSDGQDDGSDKSHDRVVAHARGSGDRPHILIFPIGYARFGGEGLAAMRRLAEETGGDFVEASSAAQLRDFFDAIAAQMTSSYIARFPADLDGAEHRIRLAVGSKAAERRVLYPDFGMLVWPWLLGLLILACALLSVWVAFARRTAGQLSIVAGASAGTSYVLRPGRTRIGALDDNDIVLPSNTVSRYHAEIVTRGGQVQISDLHSRNGTRVNGQVIEHSPLRAGDRIAIADVELVYER
jgi:VWFA-related protein